MGWDREKGVGSGMRDAGGHRSGSRDLFSVLSPSLISGEMRAGGAKQVQQERLGGTKPGNGQTDGKA